LSIILATGGLGFIGSHTCINLLCQGFDVIIVDSLINSSEKNLENIKKVINFKKVSNAGEISFYKGDLRNTKWLYGIFEKQISLKKPIDSVIHFAGLKSVKESVLKPLNYWEANINTTLSLLSAMDNFGCFNIVFSSSATIYRPIDGEKLYEDSLQKPINPYGNTKITIEKILDDLYKSNKHKWKIINLRYFNPVGAHDSGLIGEEPLNEPSNLFPIIENVVLGKTKKLFIYGNDWPTLDGTCVRDYIHIMDLSEAHYAALKYLTKNKPQNISINIGTGNGLSVLEIVKAYSRVNNIDLPFDFADRREGDASYVVADNTLALKLLNWQATKSLEDICRDSYRYVKNKLSLKN